MRRHWLAIVLAVSAILTVLVLTPRTAEAQPKGGAPRAGASVNPPGSTPVLTFETDDADDQAEAFTLALRNRIKATPGWTLSENTFSLALLTSALKCRIDAPCLQRVGEQLKTDKFFWGRVARLGKTQVVVEAHYWLRGKQDSVVKETYADDLRDANNESLKKIVNRVFERLTNTLTTGMLTVQAGKGAGTVVVDGGEPTSLSGGTAAIELKAGQHVVEVRVPGYLPVRQEVTVVVGNDTPINVKLVAEATPVAPAPEEKSNGRQILAYGLVGGGVVVGVVGAVFGAQWFSKRSQQRDLAQAQYGVLDPDGPGPVDVKVTDPCSGFPGAGPDAARRMDEACSLNKDAKTLSLIAWTAGGVGAAMIGTGVVLLVTGGKGDAPTRGAAPAPKSAWSVTPTMGPREGMLRVGLSF